LVTSRQALQLSEEWLLPVQGLSVPERIDAWVGKDDALQLFAERARQVQPKFALREHACEALRICRLVDGLPLAIEMAAYWTRLMSCQQIADEIQRNLDFLTTTQRDVPERHRSLRTVFEHSWRLLTENERRTLMKLSVFRGGFTLEAARQV